MVGMVGMVGMCAGRRRSVKVKQLNRRKESPPTLSLTLEVC